MKVEGRARVVKIWNASKVLLCTVSPPPPLFSHSKRAVYHTKECIMLLMVVIYVCWADVFCNRFGVWNCFQDPVQVFGSGPKDAHRLRVHQLLSVPLGCCLWTNFWFFSVLCWQVSQYYLGQVSKVSSIGQWLVLMIRNSSAAGLCGFAGDRTIHYVHSVNSLQWQVALWGWVVC